ncbi:MAG: hypothetical protein PHE89_03415 [Alphaproteobacteria bacterium]|nr:hypothetical protein [Alphaproteobacteria bacterium]
MKKNATTIRKNLLMSFYKEKLVNEEIGQYLSIADLEVKIIELYKRHNEGKGLETNRAAMRYLKKYPLTALTLGILVGKYPELAKESFNHFGAEYTGEHYIGFRKRLGLKEIA